MSTIVGYLYRGYRYTPLAMKEFLIRIGKIPRSAFEPRLGGWGQRLTEPDIATVIDAYANTPGRGIFVFMDQPETYSDNDWPKFIFDDEATWEEQAQYLGAPDIRDMYDGNMDLVDKKIMAQNGGKIPSRIVAKVYHSPTEFDGGNSWHYVVEAFPLHDVTPGLEAAVIDYGSTRSEGRSWECVRNALANRSDYDCAEFVQVRADRRPKP